MSAKRKIREEEMYRMNNIERYDDTIKYAIMNIVDAVNKIESMKTNEYLAMHPYAITHSQDGYYRTYLPGEKGKRRQIKKKARDDLEKTVIDYWMKHSKLSFKDLRFGPNGKN
jgi:uncharacterized protein (UPF0297 family)